MQQLTAEVSKHVISQITNKLLPVISEKYEIPVPELMELVNGPKGPNVVTPTPKVAATIRATPKKSATPKASVPKELAEMRKKIVAAQAAGKVLNVCTGRPLADSPTNRKKYKFFDELGIAGLGGSEKLKNALALFGAPSKRQVPVHEQAERAKQRANLTKSDDEDEDDEESEVEINVETDSEESEAPPPQPSFSVTKKPKTMAVKKAPAPVQEPEPEPEPVQEPEENVDTIVKLSSLIEEKAVEETAQESEPEPPAKPVKLVPRYNVKIKHWWDADTQYILKRRGAKSIVIGRLVNGDVTQLDKEDLAFCKKNGWESNTTILKPPTPSGSESTDSSNDDDS